MPISIYDPRVLDQVVSILPATGGFFRANLCSRFLPVPGTKIDVDFYKGKRRIAPFVNPKAAAKTVEKIGYKTNTFETPLLKPKDVTTVEDLSVRLPGENVYNGGMTREDRAQYLLTQKLQEFNDMNIRREEWMCAVAYYTGVIPVIGDGVNYTINLGFSNRETLSGSSLWSASTGTPLADIDRWVLACQQNGYHTPNICVMERAAYDAFVARLKANGDLNQLSQNYEVAIIAPRQLSENVIYGGTLLKWNISVYIYNEWYIDDWTDPANPAEKALVPSGSVLLASSNARSTMYYGEITITDSNAPSGFRSYIAQKAAQTWIENDPPVRFLALHSRPLFAPQEVDSWYVANVL